MAFDWPRLLRAHGVAYVTRGPNTARDHVSVKCPWCGAADPSEHLGISLKGKGWGCLRNKAHRGKSRSRLIAALLRCSSERARTLAGEETPALPPPEEDFGQRVRAAAGAGEPSVSPRTLELPTNFKPLRYQRTAELFWDYLWRRDWTNDGIDWLVRTYDLHYARSGEFRYRIIIPVYNLHNQLMTWTGRTISPNNELRYYSLSYDRSVVPIKRLVLALPMLWRVANPEVLVITEGPFDAFRVTALGHTHGVYATCLFGLDVSDEQIELIEGLAARFRRVVVLLDPEARIPALRLSGRIAGLGVSAVSLPDGIEDPGALRPREARPLFQSWLA